MRILMTSVVDLKKSQHNRPHQFARYLSQRHDVTVLSINDWWKGSQRDIENGEVDFTEFLQRIHYEYLTDRRVSPFIQEGVFRKKAKELSRRDFDVHLNYNSIIAGYEASRRLRTVFDLADDLTALIRESPQIPFFLRSIGAFVGSHYLRRELEIAKYVTITTESLREAYGIQNEKAFIIPNGVDITLFRNCGNVKKELGLNGFVVGYVGTLREWVDFKPVFDALKALDKEINMVIVGKEGDYSRCVETARECGVSDRVSFLGSVPYSSVHKYMSAMDICIIPFRQGQISAGSLPLKLFEYMACERPVICSPIPGVRSIVGDRVLYASSSVEFEDSIGMLYGDNQLRKSMGLAGRALVEDRYDWRDIVARLERLLDETAG